MAVSAATHSPNSADAYLSAREQLDSIITNLRSSQTQQMKHHELEQLIETEGRELLRLLLQAHLDERGPGAVSEPVVNAAGKSLTHRRLHPRAVASIFGQVTVTRQGYGRRGQQSLHPFDAALNLPPEIYSHTVRRRVAVAAAKESYDEVVASIAQQTGAAVPKRQAEELVARAAQDFEAFYQAQRTQSVRQVKASSALLVLSADGKGVPLRRDDLRQATRKAADQRQPHLKHRRSKGEKSHTKRMGTVAAVYTIAPFARTPEQIVREIGPVCEVARARPRPEDKRVWASIKQEPAAIIRQAFEEATRRDPQHRKQWVALSDGNRTQLGLLLAGAEEYGVELTLILDVIHVLEYLWGAAWALHAEGDRAAETWVRERLTEILRGRSSQVAAGMRRSATLRSLSAKRRTKLDACANYLLKYRAFLRYDQYLAAGYPIATGVIEGACRYLVKDRMEITGARWRLTGAEAILRLRSLRASDDFDAYWDFHLAQEQQRHHTTHYAAGKVPTPNSKPDGLPKGSHLKLVK